ncbi:hypothetical protein DLAC_09508 [Tieghemostelium lacteum]|uniref:Uncharacterized protein n=1 Tax=Tieghemostelium lacteum TaxID=361077 RepID=A0A151Z6J9_TIELA|nr:hypothetical protein DLAC_09508 [Tieghemostelium lacteum]|eukprot:KYQ89557.1 hypothetical protein DLAC_09508 [Tieghemostelium lacteum]
MKADETSKSEEKIRAYFDVLKDDKLVYSDYPALFKTIANHLQNDVFLMIQGEPYIMGELEFYYKSKSHPDSFTHCDDMQKESFTWYFHRTGNVYRSGTYKGLDITFATDDQTHAGILIRSIYPIIRKGHFAPKITDGPSLSVDLILHKTGFSNIESFVKTAGRSVFDNTYLHLKLQEEVDLTDYVKVPEKYQVMPTGRVGLTLKRYFINAEYFLTGPYRFVRFPDKIKKGKPHMVLTMIAKNDSADKIKKDLSTTAASVENIKKQYKIGKTLTSNETFKKDLSKDLLPQLFGYATTLKYKTADDKNKKEEEKEEPKEVEEEEEDDE